MQAQSRWDSTGPRGHHTPGCPTLDEGLRATEEGWGGLHTWVAACEGMNGPPEPSASRGDTAQTLHCAPFTCMEPTPHRHVCPLPKFILEAGGPAQSPVAGLCNYWGQRMVGDPGLNPMLRGVSCCWWQGGVHRGPGILLDSNGGGQLGEGWRREMGGLLGAPWQVLASPALWHSGILINDVGLWFPVTGNQQGS